MEIQSLSVVTPTHTCVNNCPFCVSKMHSSDYRHTKYNHNINIGYAEKHDLGYVDSLRLLEREKYVQLVNDMRKENIPESIISTLLYLIKTK